MDKQTNTQYHIVSGKHANIIKYINDALKKDWHLYGNLTTIVKDGNIIYSQALIKYN